MLSYLLTLLEDPSDEPLLIKLYTSHRDKAYAVAMYYLHNHYDAEDAAMDAWIWITNNFSTAKKSYSEARFDKFLFTTVKHISVDRLRKNSRRPVPLEEWDAPTPDIGAESAETKDEAEAIKRALAAVPEKYRDVFVMRQMYERSFAQIGEALKCSEDAARMRYNRAEKELRKRLKKAGYGS